MSEQVPVIPVDDCHPAPCIREPLSAEAVVELAVMFEALSDPVLRLLSSIASRAGMEACVCELSEGIDLTHPTLPPHLKVLREAGLLTGERRASWVHYRVVPQALARVSDALLLESGETAEVAA